ncbi:MAG: hypothetical protein V3T23_05405 [Nitrososphaerales archaeon]
MKVLFDYDMFAYRAASAVQYSANWADEGQPDLWTLHAKLSDGVRVFEGLINTVLKDLDATDYLMCISPRSNFRKDINPDYKSNRKDTLKPILLNPLEDYVREHHDSITMPNIEADDMLGILQTDDTIIVTQDKDLLTVAGMNYNHITKEKRKIAKDDADHWFYMQILMGDRVDGYGGLEGVGPAKAKKILEGVPMGERWAAVEEAFEKKGQDDALLMARMARILQVEDWDADKQEVILWTP